MPNSSGKNGIFIKLHLLQDIVSNAGLTRRGSARKLSRSAWGGYGGSVLLDYLFSSFMDYIPRVFTTRRSQWKLSETRLRAKQITRCVYCVKTIMRYFVGRPSFLSTLNSSERIGVCYLKCPLTIDINEIVVSSSILFWHSPLYQFTGTKSYR